MVFDNGFSRITIHKTTDVFLENFPVLGTKIEGKKGEQINAILYSR